MFSTFKTQLLSLWEGRSTYNWFTGHLCPSSKNVIQGIKAQCQVQAGPEYAVALHMVTLTAAVIPSVARPTPVTEATNSFLHGIDFKIVKKKNVELTHRTFQPLETKIIASIHPLKEVNVFTLIA